VLAKLGYLVTLWNSHSIVWLRRHLTFQSNDELVESGDSTQRGWTAKDIERQPGDKDPGG
jgi:hypothetical protein